VLVRKIGVIGVAWGTVIPDLICTAVVVPLYTLRVLKMDPWRYFVKAWIPPLVCALPVAAMGYWFSTVVEKPAWLLFGAEVAAVCAVFGSLSWFLCRGGAGFSLSRADETACPTLAGGGGQ
jgi:hypothetical protein